MSEKVLEIPVINGIDNFKQWVKKLNGQDIRSWHTKDWLKIFDAIEKYVTGKEFKTVMLQDYQKQLQEKKITPQVFDEKEKKIHTIRSAATILPINVRNSSPSCIKIIVWNRKYIRQSLKKGALSANIWQNWAILTVRPSPLKWGLAGKCVRT